MTESRSSDSSSDSSLSKTLPNYLDEKIIDDLIELGKHEPKQASSDLECLLDKVFSNPGNLSKSFHLQQNNKIKTDENILSTKPDDHCLLPLKKSTNQNETQVDFKNLRSSIKKIFEFENQLINITVPTAILKLFKSVMLQNRCPSETKLEIFMHCLVICFDLITFLAVDQYGTLSELCHAVSKLSLSYQAQLVHIWAKHCKYNLKKMVQSCQERITEILTNENVECIHENYEIMNITRTLKITFYANILAGDALESPKLLPSVLIDDLEIELNISTIHNHKPLFPYEEFYNDALSKAIQKGSCISLDSFNYLYQLFSSTLHENVRFSFCNYPFILSPVAKIAILHHEIQLRMTDSKLELKIRRDNIVDDVLNKLEKISYSRANLKQLLVVKFVNEEAIDEGGVSKELFQLIIEKLFDNNFGLFSYQEDSKTVWFNSISAENNFKRTQYKLIGIILGLAVNNEINLAMNFPIVFYRKLLGGTGCFYDLEDFCPIIFRNLKSLLDYEDDDMEDLFMQTFKIGYTNVSGQVMEYELKPGGADIYVGQHNKQEFVDLYSDYLLNKSIHEQFRELSRGFEMVTDKLPIKQLLRPEELELFICGSKNFDFVELENATVYDGGYTKETKVIQNFWSIVHAFTNEKKRKLLEFITGSDRVPVGGFNYLKFIIQRQGPDSDRLPSSHTCFNILLLPEYETKEKLKERLHKALNYTRGFGML